MSVLKFTDENFEKEVLKENKTVLVDVFATWCGPCKMQSKVLEELDNIKIVKVDVDNSEDLAHEFGIMSIPTLILFKDGKIVNKRVGFTPLSEINEYLK